MISKMVTTFLELGDATSRNLEFSHREDVHVSYGEETITEHNLLEIRRRHCKRICLETFPKSKEAQNGADWEWHIIGDCLTLKMRVQAKRTQYKKGGLRIKYNDQRKQLLDMSKCEDMKPIYCFYCTEPQRSFWKQAQENGNFVGFQTGCLLADANDVPETAKKLCEVEDKCIPWHYLIQREEFVLCKSDGLISARAAKVVGLDQADREQETNRWKAPTIEDLNGQGNSDFDHTGVHETIGEGLRQLSYPQDNFAKIPDRGIHRRLVMDVRSLI